MTLKIVHPGERQHMKALIFGPYGSGKTHFLGTAQLDERTAPALYMDFEGGDASLVGLPIDSVVVRSWQDFNEVYEALQGGEGGYKTILLDSLSETHIFALMTILDENTTREDTLQIQDYGKAGIQMRRLIRLFRDLPYHFIATSQDKSDKEARVGLVKKPALAGQMADEAPGLFDVCGYLTFAEEPQPDKTVLRVRSLLLKNYAQFRVKIRTPWGQQDNVPDYIDNPTMGLLLDALSIGAKKEEEPQEDNVVELQATKTTRRRK